ncbi:hypothetical protein Nepgr_000166 [Nepenthes gracilis]|uniref:Uncharacterized protein n=1 Tax=Nepenthes gracilis TaxID=150966 RepID=A0AAD3P605_NEPGR|nr:hypothetical protein Nepgr_000166 [Nepenthes gracilis]
MELVHGIVPRVIGYSCMIDVLGCAGLFEEAMKLIEKGHLAHRWLYLGHADHSDINLAKMAANCLLELVLMNLGAYALLSIA